MSHPPHESAPVEVQMRHPEDATDPAPSAPGEAGRPRAAQMPRRAVPITLIVLGALMILASPIVLVVSVALGEMVRWDNVEGDVFPSAAQDTAVELAAETSYWITPEPPLESGAPTEQTIDHCTLTGPGGELLSYPDETALEMYGETMQRVDVTEGGAYTIDCQGTGLLPDGGYSLQMTDDSMSPALTWLTALPAVLVLLLGIAGVVVGIVWLVRVNRRRREIAAQRGTRTIGGAAAPGGAVAGAPGGGVVEFREPAPSSDERIVLSPENAFGHRGRAGKPASMVPAVLCIVLGALVMIGGPVGGIATSFVGFFSAIDGGDGGNTTNGGSIELPENSEISVYFEEAGLEQMSDADWETYTPPPTPACRITSPDGAHIPLEVEDMGDGWENATFATTTAGAYTFDCDLTERHNDTISAFSMGPAGDAEAGGLGPVQIGLIVGAVGLVVLIIGIVMAVRTSARRHDMGA